MLNHRELHIPASEGRFSRQAHVDPPEGTFEREVGREGFFGAATHFYHENPPTGFESIEGNMRPRAFDLSQLADRSPSPWDATELFYNQHFRFRFWRPGGAMLDLARNADGDELLFVQSGRGDLFCDYGHIEYRQSDYLLLPRGTMWRVEPRLTSELILIECTGSAFKLPDWGAIGRHAPFDLGALAKPQLDDQFFAQQGQVRTRLTVKRCGSIGLIQFPYNPLDAQGWKGDLYPVRLNLDDICPLMSHKVHLPPSAFTTFLGNRFIVCSFVPRPLESADGAMKLPFFHNNDDYDEILLLHRGTAPARGNALGEGAITYHPMGFTHGPHPEALDRMFDASFTETSAYGIMVDARDPILVSPEARKCEIEAYWKSWGAGASR
jgi:homogentisate 1,2-dioxygenase